MSRLVSSFVLLLTALLVFSLFPQNEAGTVKTTSSACTRQKLDNQAIFTLVTQGVFICAQKQNEFTSDILLDRITLVNYICKHETAIMRCLDQSINNAKTDKKDIQKPTAKKHANFIKKISNYVCKMESIKKEKFLLTDYDCYAQKYNQSTCFDPLTGFSFGDVFEKCEIQTCVVDAVEKCKTTEVESETNDLIEIIKDVECGASIKLNLTPDVESVATDLIDVIRENVAGGASQTTQYSVVTFCLVVALAICKI